MRPFSRVKIKYLFTCEKKLKGFQHAHKALWMQLLGIEAQPAKTFTFLILHFNFYIFTFTLSHFYFHNFSVTFTYILTLQYFHYQTFIFTFILTSLKLQHWLSHFQFYTITFTFFLWHFYFHFYCHISTFTLLVSHLLS